jgi:hypothetical protein
MNAATESAVTSESLSAQVRTLTEGSVIEVKYGKRWDVNQPEVRTVRVTSLLETDGCFYAFTTSGRTNNVKGGCLTIWKSDGRVTFQATMQQKVGNVASLVVQGLAH